MTELVRDRDLLDANVRVFNLRNLRRIDMPIVALAMALALVGVLMQYSASYGASSILGTDDEAVSLGSVLAKLCSGYSGKQLAFLVFGILAALIIVCVDYRFLASLGPVIYAGTLALLLLTLYSPLGYEVRGAKRWLDLGMIRVQPSEFAKLGLIYMLAWYGARLGPRIQKFPYLILALLIAGLSCGLVFLQPSLSTALALLPAVLLIVYAAGCRFVHLFLVSMLGLLPAAMAINQAMDYWELGPEAYEAKSYPLGLKLKETQAQRIMTFVLPDPDPRKSGYHAIQARITVGSGQLNGKGFCKGTQTHLSFLPDFHTDFIFALLAEEWGFVGAATVVILYLLFFQRAIVLALLCPDREGRLLAVGCVALLAFHAFSNIAVTIGVLPVTGIPLPFLSYGGSFYITTFMCVGTLLSIHVRKRFFE